MAFTQFSDDFSDGDFKNNPVWSGDTSRFRINSSFQLQLKSTGEGLSELLTVNEEFAETEWRFWIRLAFSPSVNNFARVYLVSDQSSLKGELNGFFVQLGEAGSTDAIELFRQDGQNITSVCRGAEANIASAFQVRVKVTRNSGGLWTIYTDYTGGENFQEEASGIENQMVLNTYSGIYCKYTGSNSTKFYFDDFYSGPVIIDQQPPYVTSVVALSENLVRVTFSEGVEESSAENPQNYLPDQGIGFPDSAVRSDTDPKIVVLYFGYGLVSGVLYSLTVKDVRDFAQNTMQMETWSLSYYTGQRFDIVISEMMVDPSPIVGLPEFEYIELYNTLDIPVFISGWSLILGAAVKTFGEVLIPPLGYLIIADEAAAPFFEEYGLFYGFSSISLSNTGSSVSLVNADNQTIHHVTYNLEWYHYPAKEEGGWSIEQIDPLNPCGGKENWKATNDYSGGTPGKMNSVDAPNPDQKKPELSKVTIISETQIALYFSESMDSLDLVDSGNYIIDPGIGNPVSVEPLAPEFKMVTLFLTDTLEPRTEYHISVSQLLKDCSGNQIEENNSIRFGLPITPMAGDIMINEILFNPRDDTYAGVDFVEIYNRSEKIIDLVNLLVTSYDTINQLIADPEEITPEGYLIFPDEFLVLTENPEIVQSQYLTAYPERFLKLVSLPPMNNDKGIVILSTRGFEIIDRVDYNESMHHPLLNSTDGVSLERVDINRSSNDPENWHSAASTAGFATPAFQNSQFVEYQSSEEEFKLDPEIFSPDNDGYHDYLNIYLNFPTPGLMASITIFDPSGRMVRNLVNNEMISSESTFVWDGIDQENQKANTGIYIVFIEVFGLDGKIQRFRKTTVLATKM